MTNILFVKDDKTIAEGVQYSPTATALVFGLPITVALSVFLYRQYNGISSFAFSLPWKEMLVCAIGALLIMFITMLSSGSRSRSDNIIDTIAVHQPPKLIPKSYPPE